MQNTNIISSFRFFRILIRSVEEKKQKMIVSLNLAFYPNFLKVSRSILMS